MSVCTELAFPLIPALKMFLNAETELSRTLLLKLLKSLWPIHTWASTQTSLRLYSSSLLLVYDAKRLKTEIFCNRNSPRNNSNESVPRPPEKEGTSNQKAACNGNTTNLSKPIASSQHHVDQRRSNGHNNHDCSVISNENIQLYRQLQRSHSAQNNYEEVGLQSIFSATRTIHLKNSSLFQFANRK